MITSGPREMTDGVVRLREVAKEDAPRLYAWRMDPDTRPMFRDPEEVPYETHLAFVERYFQPANTDRWFVIEDAGGPVGTIALYGLTGTGEAEWGRLVIDPLARGRGYARRALRLVIDHALELGVRKLHCEVSSSNGAARHLYRTEGFAEAGRERCGRREFIQMTRSRSER